jgi:DNA polymerase III alpha subunit
MIFEEFTDYDDCEPAGVELPKTPVNEETLIELGLNSSSSNKEIMYELARKGLRDKGITSYKNKEVYFDRVQKELTILDELGFTDYILLNWDILNYCHTQNIPTGAGRGSAAGSLVLYLLGVTNIDPIPHDLFFVKTGKNSSLVVCFQMLTQTFLMRNGSRLLNTSKRFIKVKQLKY